MALNIKIDLEDRYPVYMVNGLNYSLFDTELKNGELVRLGIQISVDPHPLMPNVYNLAFGPVNENNQIDDITKLTHNDHSKVFSTIVFESLTFLTDRPNDFLGIDGSNTARAYMYYRCIQNNFDYLNNYFTIFGIDYYVRVLRGGVADYEDVLTIPKSPIKGQYVKPGKLYNYFIFKAKDSVINYQKKNITLIYER